MSGSSRACKLWLRLVSVLRLSRAGNSCGVALQQQQFEDIVAKKLGEGEQQGKIRSLLYICLWGACIRAEDWKKSVITPSQIKGSS